MPYIKDIDCVARLPTMADNPRVMSYHDDESMSSSSTVGEPEQVQEQRCMKVFSLPTIGLQPSAILLDEAQRNYELKNLH